MRKIALLVAIVVCAFSYAQDSVSVLFIGNSYIYTNDLPTVFSTLTTSLGDEATVDSKVNGGFTFQNQLVDPVTHTKIQAKLWDFVVLQGQSQEPSFPTSQVDLATLPPAVSLSDSVYANWYCSQAMYFMTWGRQNGDPQWDSINTFDKMNGRLRNAYLRIADSAQASVSPVGVAWKYVRDNYPTINLYSADGSHPSIEGTYLSACTFYASVFRKTPVGASYLAGLGATTAEALQTAAALAVLDSLDTWHLRPKEEISIADFHFVMNGNSVQFFNDSWRSNNYWWSFSDGGSSIDENPIHVFTANGNYTIALTASSECGSDTVYQTLSIGGLNIDNQKEQQFRKRNLGLGIYEIDGFIAIQPTSFTLIDVTGKKLNKDNSIIFSEELQKVTIDLSGFSNGVYFLRMETENGDSIIDLPKF
jgi:PKD repeat protein